MSRFIPLATHPTQTLDGTDAVRSAAHILPEEVEQAFGKIVALGIANRELGMDIVGHSSNTGPAALNDTLSLQRARFVQQRLVGESVALRNRTTPSGKGFRENIIGSGTDDAVDALDRRGEFRIVDCG